jgi:deoxyribodipyrimidine photolyase-related protein
VASSKFDPSALLVILGNQLFPTKHLPGPHVCRIFMAEDHELCTYYKFHKHKIVLFLTAMRCYAEELRTQGYDVHYVKLDDAEPRSLSYEDKLERYLNRTPVKSLSTFEIEDKFMEVRLSKLAAQQGLPLNVMQSPMFLTSRADFAAYLRRSKKPFMKTFYEQRRRELDVLMDGDGRPVGGKFSFDDENRESLPQDVVIPKLPKVNPNTVMVDVGNLVSRLFPEHPGSVSDFWLPVTLKDSQLWLDDFLEKRLGDFGRYEDAMTNRDVALFHSVLSPMMNLGLLTPDDVLRRALSVAKKRNVALNSLEGFIRQVIGWREFVRGIYQNYSERQDRDNFFKHTRRLNSNWYEGKTGLPPLDDAIKKTMTYGWAHHIERLMIISCVMLLTQIDPRDVHRWFMEMYVDSSDWVMGPNVYGMGQFSDGGIFATKPYICGSNYVLKMSDYKKGPWCEEWDGLYWKFVAEKFQYLGKNPRLSMMVAMWQKKSPAQKNSLMAAADRFIQRNSSDA